MVVGGLKTALALFLIKYKVYCAKIQIESQLAALHEAATTLSWDVVNEVAGFSTHSVSKDVLKQQLLKLLEMMTACNKYIIKWILRAEEALDFEQPDYITVGGEDEAIMHVQRSLSAWKTTPGAIDFVREEIRYGC